MATRPAGWSLHLLPEPAAPSSGPGPAPGLSAPWEADPGGLVLLTLRLCTLISSVRTAASASYVTSIEPGRQHGRGLSSGALPAFCLQLFPRAPWPHAGLMLGSSWAQADRVTGLCPPFGISSDLVTSRDLSQCCSLINALYPACIGSEHSPGCLGGHAGPAGPGLHSVSAGCSDKTPQIRISHGSGGYSPGQGARGVRLW